MPKKDAVSRRRFLGASSAITGTSILRIGAPALIAIVETACTAKQESSAFTVLSAADAADFAAMAARIIPSTDTPGATEAGVIHFIDRALGSELRDDHTALQSGLADLNNRVAKMFPDFSRLSELDDAAQDQVLKKIENESFFDDVRHLTITGFFAMSAYGGNKDNLAWNLLAFEGNHGAWVSPFGYYDAEFATEQSNGE